MGGLGWRDKVRLDIPVGVSKPRGALSNEKDRAVKKIEDQDVISVSDFFKELEDPRCHVNRKHLLTDIIVICICAVVSGADGPVAIGVWAKAKKDWLEKLLELPHGIPSHDTIGRVLAALKPSAFQTCFEKWTALFQRQPDALEEGLAEHIAIDGKALRHSYDKLRGLGSLFLISAWSVRCGISLGQLAIEEKTSEITAIPELLDNLDITRAIITIDAAGCQKNIAKQIIDQGGDYVLALKGNQRNIYKAVKNFIAEQTADGSLNVGGQYHEVNEKGHGRLDSYQYHQFPVPTSLKDREKWSSLTTIGAAVRISNHQGKVTRDTRYFLSSLSMGVKQFAQAVRGHWAIENTLHWCLDVTFREDESRLRDRIAGENVAWLRRFGLGLIKQHQSKDSVAMRRRMAGWNDDYLAQLLGLVLR
jgi:predicted transposase YbfD/YdcC